MKKNKNFSEWEIRAFRAKSTDQRQQQESVTLAVISYIHQTNLIGGKVAKEN